MNLMPCSARSTYRRAVSVNFELPPSRMMSPSSSSETSSPITASTAAPAFTMRRTTRGEPSWPTSSSRVVAGAMPLLAAGPAMKSSVTEVVRLYTDTRLPESLKLRARLAPITPRPTTPMSEVWFTP